jgi:hypothetical protein
MDVPVDNTGFPEETHKKYHYPNEGRRDEENILNNHKPEIMHSIFRKIETYSEQNKEKS